MIRKKILVTGATGFLGGHLLPKLLEKEYEITCLVRETSNTQHLPKEVKTVCANLSTGKGLREALEGHDVLIHMAALLFGTSWNNYLSSNVLAAQSLCKAINELKEKGPREVVLVSSQAALGPSDLPQGLSEEAPSHPVSAYGWSKLFVERTFQSQFSNRLVILRPGIIYGSLDRGLLPLFKACKMGFTVSPGRNRDFFVSIVHADDMALAILLALSSNAHGIYNVSDGLSYTMYEFSRAIARALGKDDLRIFHVPLPLMAFSAALATLFSQIQDTILPNPLRRAPNWNSDKYREAAQCGWICSSRRIQEELGFSPEISLEKGMQEAVQGYRNRGWL